jgi:hypothetical protein
MVRQNIMAGMEKEFAHLCRSGSRENMPVPVASSLFYSIWALSCWMVLPIFSAGLSPSVAVLHFNCLWKFLHKHTKKYVQVSVNPIKLTIKINYHKKNKRFKP